MKTKFKVRCKDVRLNVRFDALCEHVNMRDKHTLNTCCNIT